MSCSDNIFFPAKLVTVTAKKKSITQFAEKRIKLMQAKFFLLIN